MFFYKINRDNKYNRRVLNMAMIAAYVWLFIVFILRRVFVYFNFNLFVLGFLPSLFAGMAVYLFLTLQFQSKTKSALVAFSILSLTEIIQLFTPRTFDPLDFTASIIGIAGAEFIRRMIEKKNRPIT